MLGDLDGRAQGLLEGLGFRVVGLCVCAPTVSKRHELTFSCHDFEESVEFLGDASQSLLHNSAAPRKQHVKPKGFGGGTSVKCWTVPWE